MTRTHTFYNLSFKLKLIVESIFVYKFFFSLFLLGKECLEFFFFFSKTHIIICLSSCQSFCARSSQNLFTFSSIKKILYQNCESHFLEGRLIDSMQNTLRNRVIYLYLNESLNYMFQLTLQISKPHYSNYENGYFLTNFYCSSCMLKMMSQHETRILTLIYYQQVYILIQLRDG